MIRLSRFASSPALAFACLLALAACTGTHNAAPPRGSHEVSPPAVNGNGVAVQVKPTVAPTGSTIRLVVTTSSPHGAAGVESIAWGDGSVPEQEIQASSCPAQLPGSATPSSSRTALPPPSRQTQTFRHRYRSPGQRTITVHSASSYGCDAPTFPAWSATTTRAVTLTGPALPGNGANPPQPALGIFSYQAGLLRGDIRANDDDGYVRILTVTWPDGITHTFSNPTPCVDPGDHWPHSEVQIPWRHAVSGGKQTIRATVTSTDCRGTHVQTRTDLRFVILSNTGWSNATPANRLSG